jgi:hypothetical protein
MILLVLDFRFVILLCSDGESTGLESWLTISTTKQSRFSCELFQNSSPATSSCLLLFSSMLTLSHWWTNYTMNCSNW